MNILLKVLTGPHIGAELELTQRDWVIGSDLECDILLMDVAVLSRHALIRVAENRAWLIPQDGDIVVNNILVAREGQELIPFTPFSIGGSYLCCGPAHRPWTADEMPTLAALNQQAHNALAPTKEAQATVEEAESIHEDMEIQKIPHELNNIQTGTTQEETQKAKSALKDKISLTMRVVLCFILLALLTLGIRHYTMPQDVQATIDALLSKKNYENVQAHKENDAIILRGFVAKNKEIIALEDLLQGLEDAVAISIDIFSLEDVADEIRAIALEKDAIWSIRVRNAMLYVNGYVQSESDFMQMLTPVQDKLQSIPKQIEMIYWDALEQTLYDKIKSAQITHKIQFYPHVMRIGYAAQDLTVPEGKRLETLFFEVEDQFLLGDIFIPMHSKPIQKGSMNAKESKNTDTTDKNTLCASLSLASQGHQTVVMMNGVPYAQGNRLPQGWLVQEIHPSYIVLLFDKQMHICQPTI